MDMVQLLWKSRSFHQLNVFELQAIYKLRQEVFILEQNCVYLDADGKDQFADHIFGVSDDGRVLAYCRVLQPGTVFEEVSIGRVATNQEVRRTGLGKLLMEKSFKLIEERYGSVPVRIEAQFYLKDFYQQMGFEQTGLVYDLDGIDHIEMVRNIGVLVSR